MGAGLVMTRGERGHQLLFLLPALLFTVAVVIFPTFFGLYIAFTDWNLSSVSGRALQRSRQYPHADADAFFWNALGNMVWYVLAVLVQYAIAFGACPAAQRGDQGPQVLPRRLPAALHAEPGRRELDDRQVDHGVPLRPGRRVGATSRLGQPRLLRFAVDRAPSIMAMDAWVWIPFIMILMLAGLQAMPHEVARPRRSTAPAAGRSFWKITFPLMLPVSVTAVILRIIFELKLADIVINVTAGGPAGRPTRCRASSIASIAIARTSATAPCSPSSTWSSSSCS